MSVALVVWRLIGVNFHGRPDTPYWLEKDGRVCDVDGLGWERGVRPGMARSTVQWRYPEGKVVAWEPQRFFQITEAIQAWLAERMERFEQLEPWTGWWEWPSLRLEQFEQHMADVIPRWALRVEAGVASHPLLAKAALSVGDEWRLPLWSGSGFHARVLSPAEEGRWWPEIPLALIEGVSGEMRRQWNMRGWKRVGQVPGLQFHLRNSPTSPANSIPETIKVQYRWEQEADGGFIEVFSHLAAQLTEELHRCAMGFHRLDMTWHGEWGMIRHQRKWPIATGESGGVVLRLLDFLKKLPPSPPNSVEIVCGDLVPWGTEQIQWEFSGPSREVSKKLGTGVCIGMNRREAVLQFWDPWRFPHRQSPRFCKEANGS